MLFTWPVKGRATVLVVDRPKNWTLVCLRWLHRLGLRVIVIEDRGTRRSPQWRAAYIDGWLTRVISGPSAPIESNAMALSLGIVADQLQADAATLFDNASVSPLVQRQWAEIGERLFHLFHHVPERPEVKGARVLLVSPWAAGIFCRLKQKDLWHSVNENADIRSVGAVFGYFYGVIDYLRHIAGSIARLGRVAAGICRAKQCVGISCAAPLAIALSSPWLAGFSGPRKYNFLVDGQELRPEDVVFIDECGLSPSWVAAEREKGWRIEVQPLAHPGALCRYIPPVKLCQCAVLLLRGLLRFDAVESKARRVLFDEYIKACFIKNMFNVKIYLYANKDDLNQIGYNMAMRSVGIAPWSYLPFMGGPYLYDRANTKCDMKNVLWSYQNPNRMFVYSDAQAESQNLHCQQVTEYSAIGSMFASLVAAVPRQEVRARLGGGDATPIVGFFDTSYVDQEDSFTTFEDGLLFYEALLRLAREEQDLVIAVKPFKELRPGAVWFGNRAERFGQLWNVLRSQVNIRLLNPAFDPIELIAAADLVITDCYSTPTADALMAGKRGFWLDASGKNRDYPLDRCGLVRHGYDELRHSVRQLLACDELSCHQNLFEDPNVRQLIGPGSGGLAALRHALAAAMG